MDGLGEEGEVLAELVEPFFDARVGELIVFVVGFCGVEVPG